MYWRKSLQITVILTVIGLAFGQGQSFLLTYLIGAQTMDRLNIQTFIAVAGWIRVLIQAVVTFFVVAWALRSVSGKVKRDRLTAQDALDELDEDEIAVLKQMLIPPSQRAS